MKAPSSDMNYRLNLLPSSPRGRLADLTISYALSFHLIHQYDMYLNSDGVHIIGMSLQPTFDKFKGVKGKTSELPELEEIISILCMTCAAWFSSHSGVIGGLANGAPSFKEIGQLEPFNSDLSKLSEYGLARHDATLSLGAKLSQAIENFSFETSSPSAAITYTEVVRFGLTALTYTGVSAEVRHHLERLFIFRSQAFLKSARLSDMERMRLTATIDDIYPEELGLSLRLGAKPFQHSKLTSSGPIELSPLTTPDLDVLLDPNYVMSPMEHRQRQVGILRAPDKSGSVMQVMWVMMENLATKLASRQKLQGLESTCYHCWVTVDSAFASFDNFWEPVFNDPRWKLTRFKARSMLGDVFTMIAQTEVTLVECLLACHSATTRSTSESAEPAVLRRWKALKGNSLTRLTKALTRVTNRCNVIFTAFEADKGFFTYFGLMNVGEILSLFPEESIMNWIEKFPDEGALLVKLLRTTSFIHPKTSHFIKHLESLLEKTRTRRASASRMVNSTLLKIQGMGQSDSANEKLRRKETTAGSPPVVTSALSDVEGGRNSESEMEGTRIATKMVQSALEEIIAHKAQSASN